MIGLDLATHKCFQAKNCEFDERFLRQVIQIVLFIYESEIFLRFDADNALSVTFHSPGEYLSINCCENCFCLKLLIRDFCEPFSGSF